MMQRSYQCTSPDIIAFSASHPCTVVCNVLEHASLIAAKCSQRNCSSFFADIFFVEKPQYVPVSGCNLRMSEACSFQLRIASGRLILSLAAGPSEDRRRLQAPSSPPHIPVSTRTSSPATTASSVLLDNASKSRSTTSTFTTEVTSK